MVSNKTAVKVSQLVGIGEGYGFAIFDIGAFGIDSPLRVEFEATAGAKLLNIEAASWDHPEANALEFVLRHHDEIVGEIRAILVQEPGFWLEDC